MLITWSVFAIFAFLTESSVHNKERGSSMGESVYNAAGAQPEYGFQGFLGDIQE